MNITWVFKKGSEKQIFRCLMVSERKYYVSFARKHILKVSIDNSPSDTDILSTSTLSRGELPHFS